MSERTESVQSKIAETADHTPHMKGTYSELSIIIHSISMAGYVCVELQQAGEQNSFCDFFLS